MKRIHIHTVKEKFEVIEALVTIMKMPNKFFSII